MNYKNGELIFPPELLEELQKYVQGELVYIPKMDKKRAGWGEMNGTRNAISRRNLEIFRQYQKGSHISILAGNYHLSEDSIRKIVTRLRKYS